MSSQRQPADGISDGLPTNKPTQQKASCTLCPRACRLAQGARGWCGARMEHDGAVVPEHYGHISSLALDPIEKKPLAFFHPGSMILSMGGYGCNLDCPFCQNSSIAHGWTELSGSRETPVYHENDSALPNQLVTYARAEVARGNIGIAYTYNEPLIDYEFVSDCARRVHEEGLLNVIVTNGYLNEEPWLALLPHLDAANIDLKGFTQDFYDVLGAPRGLETVKRNIASAASRIHIEVTTLIVPGLNDSLEEIGALAAWLASVNPHIPLHLSRFFPQHRMQDRMPTPRSRLSELAEVAREHLAHVQLGNV